MGSFSLWHWIIVLLFIGVPVLVVVVLVKSSKGKPGEVADTWKFRTVVYLVLAFAIPLWIITLPLCLYLAYKSYRAGDEADSLRGSPLAAPSTQSKAAELAALHELVAKGALTEDEYSIEKKKILGPA